MSEVIVVLGAGQIGQAIARRVASGKQVLLADLREENAKAAADVFADAGFEASTAISFRCANHRCLTAVKGERPHSAPQAVHLAFGSGEWQRRRERSGDFFPNCSIARPF